ncbi:hypothetical protein TWF696_009580 [Orbilia brochopaga]|uniref:Uncharacterized protein n=1 Tax=Orbilia brochopaga TaxID=3140254 RepID=A0AAV9UBF6_9PEZI
MLTEDLLIFRHIMGAQLPDARRMVEEKKAENERDLAGIMDILDVLEPDNTTNTAYECAKICLEMLKDTEKLLGLASRYLDSQEEALKQSVFKRCERKGIKWNIEHVNDRNHRKFAIKFWKLRQALQAVDRGMGILDVSCSLWPDFAKKWPYVEYVLEEEFGEDGNPNSDELAGYLRVID